MKNEEHHKNTSSALHSFLRLGRQSFWGTVIFVGCCALLALWLLPALSYVLGSGWVAPILVSMFIFLAFLFFKNVVFERIFPMASSDGEAELIEYLVRENASGHPDEEIETELLENALHLKQVKIKDCMTPRGEIIATDVRSSLEDLRHLIEKSYLSRVIITDDGLDNVVGYVHVQQLFGEPKNIRRLVLPIAFVPETMAVNDLLQKFIRNRSSIVCVVDEYGSTAGIVTLEDALEQLVGDIDDEHDQEEFVETKISDTEYLLSGRLDIAYINEKYPELDLPEGDYQTLSGYLISAVHNIPTQGHHVVINDKTFVVELVSDRKIETVRVLL